MENPQLAYQKQSVMNVPPLKLVVKLYDLAIQASYREDSEKMRDILSTLIKGLNFDFEPADQLFELYRYCQELARQKKFEEFRELLEPIRDTWEEVSNRAPSENAPN
ncbi:flagellar export chaperone FliS [Gracilimonas mengyeensis]|uniref:Flagellin-specific chaperone FliS n=1 Tax=Gracilimonas mengyeensis TaxID=1302730 RepID=A0A521FIG0_9BACT|nr:flagellar export chaperone FliS [Gracilimonas mengyeensis]SMO95906.1 Flagellin-specific chaperone FliS [Gracilimonas mengyeensis]